MEGDREGPQADGSETVSDKAASQARKRERSQIEFPYTDIGQASELVHALYHKGGGSAEREQLAAWMNQSASGGTFRSRVSAAAMFGFIRGQRGNIDITELGREVVDDASRPAALVEAFLRVPLFHALFDKFNGYPLPPPDALESQMVQLGVPEKQKERARQTFYGSARVAGFLDPTNGQFVSPAVRVHEANAQSFGEKKIEEPEQYEGLENRENARRHPFIEGLLKELPDEGENWPVRERTKWLRLAAQAFEMIYKGEGEIEISEKIKETAPHSEAPS